MKNIQKIIAMLGGDKFTHIRIDHPSPSMMRLCIERVGDFGPNKLPLYSVAHYYEQEGDLMADPEMTFAEAAAILRGKIAKAWHPVSFRMDGSGIYQEGERGAMGFHEDGRGWARPKLVKDLKSFAFQWDRNIKNQGYLDAAKKIASEVQVFEA